MVRLAQGISRRVSFKQLSIEGGIRWMPRKNDSPETVDYILSRYINNVRITQSICKEYGVRCLFVLQPVPFYKCNKSCFQPQCHSIFGKIPSYFSGFYARIAEKPPLKENFLYLGDMLENSSGKVFIDCTHYNDVFNEKIAQKICELIKIDKDD
jgi:hypothetical protein